MNNDKTARKHANASSYLKKIALILIVAAMLFIVFFKVGYVKQLTITHQETGEVYLKMRVEAGDSIGYYWIHSFEHIPWTESYEILENDHLLLHEITVAGFGAGIPENKGKVTIKDGLIIMNEIEQDFDGIHWINSNTALVGISLNGDEIVKGSDLPHHEPLDLLVKGRLSVWLRFR